MTGAPSLVSCTSEKSVGLENRFENEDADVPNYQKSAIAFDSVCYRLTSIYDAPNSLAL